MRIKTVNLDTESKQNVILRPMLPFDYGSPVYPKYQILPTWDFNRNILQVLSAVILRIQFESTVYKLSFQLLFISVWKYSFAPNLWISKSIIFTVLIDMKNLAPNVFTVERLECSKAAYCGRATDMPTKKVEFSSDIMCNKIALCNHVTSPP